MPHHRSRPCAPQARTWAHVTPLDRLRKLCEDAGPHGVVSVEAVVAAIPNLNPCPHPSTALVLDARSVVVCSKCGTPVYPS